MTGRKTEQRSYLGNYDSRKEKRKMIQSNVSVRNRKQRQERPQEDHQSQGSAHVYGTNSEHTRDGRSQPKSTFFKKKQAQDARSPLVGYKATTRAQAKGGYLSKTDDLKFLKEIGRDAKRSKSRRGSSAYPKEKLRTVHFAQNEENLNLHQEPATLLSSQNISDQREEEREAETPAEARDEPKGGISRSVVVDKRAAEIDCESRSHRETGSEIQYIKRKYLKKRSVGRREPDPLRDKPPTWKFLKASPKHTARKGAPSGKPGQAPNERSKSIEQGPTYLASLQSSIQGPERQKLAGKGGGLDNFYVASSHQSNEQTESQTNWSERRRNQPEIGVEGLHQSHPVNRNK